MSEIRSFENHVPLSRPERLSEVVSETRAALKGLRSTIEVGFGHEADPLMAEQALRRVIVERAAGYVGKVFEEGKNRGKAIAEFMPDGKTGRAWCAAFATFCLQQAYVQAGLAPERQLFAAENRMNLLSAGNLLATMRNAKAFHLNHPQPGDLVFFRARTRSGFHVGVVTALQGGSFTVVEGNVDALDGPGRREGVGQNTYSLNNPKLVGFASPLADAPMTNSERERPRPSVPSPDRGG